MWWIYTLTAIVVLVVTAAVARYYGFLPSKEIRSFLRIKRGDQFSGNYSRKELANMLRAIEPSIDDVRNRYEDRLWKLDLSPFMEEMSELIGGVGTKTKEMLIAQAETRIRNTGKDELLEVYLTTERIPTLGIKEAFRDNLSELLDEEELSDLFSDHVERGGDAIRMGEAVVPGRAQELLTHEDALDSIEVKDTFKMFPHFEEGVQSQIAEYLARRLDKQILQEDASEILEGFSVCGEHWIDNELVDTSSLVANIRTEQLMDGVLAKLREEGSDRVLQVTLLPALADQMDELTANDGRYMRRKMTGDGIQVNVHTYRYLLEIINQLEAQPA